LLVVCSLATKIRETVQLDPALEDFLTASQSSPARIVPVIMSGGSGTRLWPLSTSKAPKQFHDFGAGRSLIQETVLRMTASDGVDFLPPILICNVQHKALVERHLAEIGVAPTALVAEPIGRNTAPVAAMAAHLVAELHPGALALLLPADHIVGDGAAFHAAVARAAPAARDHIVTFGIQATRPETGYGYIRSGELLHEGVFKVDRFAEKPSRETAEGYLAEGGYSWNAGIFLFSPEVMLAEMNAHRPDIADASRAVLAAAPRLNGWINLDADAFAACPSESIDIAVMEPTARAAVAAPCEIGWADIGAWNELWRVGDKDEGGNRSHGEVVAIDTTDSLLWADGVTVTAVGVHDLMIIATRDAVIVLPKDRAQDVKRVVEELKKKGRPT